jgi:hypothetical protein
VLKKSKNKNPKTTQLTHVEFRLLKKVINLIGFLIIDFFVVKDLKRLAFLLVSLQLKPIKTNTITLITLCLEPMLLFLLRLLNKNSLIQDPFVPNNPQLLNLIQDPYNISHIKDHYEPFPIMFL